MTESPRYLPVDWVVPEVSEISAPYFTSGELRLQRCLACGTVQHPPLEICHACQAFDFEHVTAAGTGTVASFAVVHHAPHPMLRVAVPYNVVVVELTDHPHVRVVGNVIDAEPGELGFGLPVEASWATVPGPPPYDELKLLQWRRAAPRDEGGSR